MSAEPKLKPFADCRLYGFVDSAYLDGRDPSDLASALCDGGADLVQVRAKDASESEVRRLVSAVLPITRAAGVWCVLNDHWALGCELGVPCVHLGQEDFFDVGHRFVTDLPSAGFRPAIGLSSHAPEQFQRAEAAGADYVAVGPVFPTGTKPGRAAMTLDYVRWAAAHATRPWFAIGGIHEGNLDEVLAAGAQRICVVSAILRAPDVRAATQRLRSRIP